MKIKHRFVIKKIKVLIFIFFALALGVRGFRGIPVFSRNPFFKTGSVKKNEVQAYVTRIIDGDTIEVKILTPAAELQKKEKIRLIGVDTPETKHPTKKVEYFGKEAAAYTTQEIEGRQVLLQFDRTLRDKYDRLLCYVFRMDDNFFLNYQLIYEGYGYAYTKYPFTFKSKFEAAQQSAKKRHAGLWAKKKTEGK